jgi:hypothetical protein
VTAQVRNFNEKYKNLEEWRLSSYKKIITMIDAVSYSLSVFKESDVAHFSEWFSVHEIPADFPHIDSRFT